MPIFRTIRLSFVLIIFLMINCTKKTNAQKGLFIKISIGSGYTTEYSISKQWGHQIVSKNHAIGWSINERFAVQIAEFGGLLKMNIITYNFINIDGIGLGFIYRIKKDLKLSVVGGYQKLSFAKKWTEATGVNGGHGYGLNTSIDKEWFLADRWGLNLGPQFTWSITNKTNFRFINMSLNASIIYYFKPRSKE